ncbi:MAG: hypothetical protein BAJATHORv1_50056 [Candidatus Thorarchaeota archaeon]|nr:MAG: hypothetical protein BAJATHORv1_50056 [Candidatus Thorarchaeota archaeon]
MRGTRFLSLILVFAFLAPAFFPAGLASYECYVFYDANAVSGDSINVGLDMIQTICDDDVTLRLVSVESKRDLRVSLTERSSAIFLFHGNEDGLSLTDSEDDSPLMTWSELAGYIDKTSFSEYMLLSCDSSEVNELTMKERVLTFTGEIDSKVATAVAISKIGEILRHYSFRGSYSVFNNLIETIQNDDTFIQRLFNPIDTLGDYGKETSVQHGLLVARLKEFRKEVHGMAQLVITKKSYQHQVELAFITIMDLVTGDLYSLMKDAGEHCAALLDDLNNVASDIVSGSVSVSTIMNAVDAVLDIYDLASIVLEMVTNQKVRYILEWIDLGMFIADICYAYVSVKAQMEDSDYGGRNIESDSLAMIMDDEAYRDIDTVLYLPDRTSVVNAIDNLITALEGTFNYNTIRNKADRLSDICDDALTIAPHIGGDTEDYVMCLLESVKDAADSIYDSGAYHLDRYARDNFYYEMDWSVNADWWAGKLHISYSFTNPSCNQIPIYRIVTDFEETKTGNSRYHSKYFSYYLLPGSSYDDSFDLSYDRWKSWNVVFTWSLTWKYNSDLYGTYKAGDADGDGLKDWQELESTFGYRTCPTKRDTDGDGWPDKYEIDNGYNPLNSGSHPPDGGGGGGGLPGPIIVR